jgi:hypothetical protein
MKMNRNRAARQAEAIERKEARAALTDQQQLSRLDKILGVGIGAKKERERLARRIVSEAKKKTASPKKKTA